MAGKTSKFKWQDIQDENLWRSCRFSLKTPGPCPDSQMLASFLDHRLSDVETERIEAHLVQCSQCLQGLLSVHDAIENREDMDLTPRDIKQFIDLVPERKGFWHHLEKGVAFLFPNLSLPAPLVAACIILACIAGFYTGMQTGMEQKTFHSTLASELEFSLDSPDYDIFGEVG